MAKRRGTPIWVTIGCGCLLLVALVIGGMVAAGYYGVSSFQGYIEDMKDPASRAARAAEILGAEQLPEGYTAQFYFRIPWFLDMVMLSDGEPMVIEGEEDVELESDSVGEHMFMYFKVRTERMDDEDIERMLRGESTSEGVRTDLGFEFDPEEELGRGELEIGKQHLAWVAHRGEIDFEDGDMEGVFSQLIVDCPGKEMTRVAVWFRRDPEDPDVEEDPGVEMAPDLAGGPADPQALESFMSHFDLCKD